MNSCHSQTHDPGKVREIKVMEAFGLSNIYYVLSLSGDNEVKVDNQNHCPWRHPSWGANLKGCCASRFTWGHPGPLAFTW